MNDWKECRNCGDDIHSERWSLGYRVCLFCGEEAARMERMSWCVVQEYGKGNYQLVTPASARVTLKQTNHKELRGCYEQRNKTRLQNVRSQDV
jgi:hypothetical protein